MTDANRAEGLGPAERIISAVTQHVDHLVHNRPGVVVQDGRAVGGARWEQATWVKEGDVKVVYTVKKVGKRQNKTRVGVGEAGTDQVKEGGRVVARFQPPGIFPEVAAYLYQQVADVYRLDNEFVAKWASHAYKHESNRDLKVVLAAFLLVQNRFGAQIQDGDDTFLDDDYRSVGEAMLLIHSKGQGDVFNPKLLLRIGELLALPQVAEINRSLGFGKSMRNAAMGRYTRAIEKWLEHIDANHKLLEGLVKAGFRRSVMRLAQKVGYKPASVRFFETLRWSQKQADTGHRSIAIGKRYELKDDWSKFTESQICEKIVSDKPGYKLIIGKLPKGMGLTPAIMAAAVEAGSVSNQDLIILTPTLEDLGLLQDGDIHKRWKDAVDKAENQRALNVARNVKSKVAKDGLEEAADKASAKAIKEVSRDVRVYVCVDISGSMENAIETAKDYVSKFVGAIPLDKLHVSVFNTSGREVKIESATSAAVKKAFMGIRAGGGTDYASGVSCLLDKHKPTANEDALFIFVGDEGHYGHKMDDAWGRYGVHPAAIGRLYVNAVGRWNRRPADFEPAFLKGVAAQLKVPCFDIDEGIFADPYAVPRTIRNLIASTPVTTMPSVQRRKSMVDTILDTDLLQKPAWA